MDGRRSPPPLPRQLRSLLEQYTPDGALGRFLLGVPTGTVGLWLLAILTFEIPRWGSTVGTLFWAPLLFAVGTSAVGLAILVLWPVYLSLIGNIESAESYSIEGGGANRRSRTSGRTETSESARTSAIGTGRSGGTDGDDRSEDDPFADLKAQYANGDISEEEFERRIDERLQDGASRSRSVTGESDRERTPERT